MGKINPNLCKHIWKYGFNYSKPGTIRPKIMIVLYCEKCAKIKTNEIKD